MHLMLLEAVDGDGPKGVESNVKINVHHLAGSADTLQQRRSEVQTRCWCRR